ncbi:MAG: hypothetical protein KIT31_40610 [Deltaproteobacteria bacterium]|nr:hypothetical protein [Deltaproteobacteria bacterium]
MRPRCPTCGQKVTHVNGLRWSGVRADGPRTGGSGNAYRCAPCAATWWQALGTALVSPEQHEARRAAPLPVATLRPPREP